jgi:phosphoribosylamine--glycine ligase
MEVLIVGSGGREHALAWKLAQESDRVYCAPGNGGTARLEKCENVPIEATEINKLADFAKDKKIDLTVVGPEDPLVRGIYDEFSGRGLKLFGPSKSAARIEGSKAFSSELCNEYHIAIPEFSIFHNYAAASRYLHDYWRDDYKIVPKGDGLAGGKAAIVCDTLEEAEEALKRLMIKREFGDAGDIVVLQERLYGEEFSEIGVADGKNYIGFATTQDHKPIFDGDKGPNTGGMGAYSPAPVALGRKDIVNGMMNKAVDGMRGVGREYKGVLYGAMMVTPKGTKALEFNARLGDPETQPLFLRMKSGLADYLFACIEGNLGKMDNPIYNEAPAVCIVLASAGYPGKAEKGKLITGLDEAAKLENVYVFHAGTKEQDGKFYTSGGRVLGVTAMGRYENDFRGAIDLAYEAVGRIKFDGMQFRNDIGQKAFKHIQV